MGQSFPGTLSATNSAKLLLGSSSLLIFEGLQDKTQGRVFNFDLTELSLILLW